MSRPLMHVIYDDIGQLVNTDCLRQLFDVAHLEYKIKLTVLRAIKEELLSPAPLTAWCIDVLNDMGVTVEENTDDS